MNRLTKSNSVVIVVSFDHSNRHCNCCVLEGFVEFQSLPLATTVVGFCHRHNSAFLKADMNSDIPLETAVIFFSSESFS